MTHNTLPPADENGIVRAMPPEISEENRRRIRKFDTFIAIYDFAQDRWVRPRLHKADPERHREILSRLTAPVRNARILDIGCGTGSAIPLFHESNEYVGLDISYAMLKRAVKRAQTKPFRDFLLIQGTAEKLPLDTNFFDFVFCDTAIHMIPDYRKAVGEIKRVLKPNGELVCSCPTVGIHAGFDTTWKRIAKKRGLHSLEKEQLKAVCANNELSFQQIATNGGVLYFRAQKKAAIAST